MSFKSTGLALFICVQVAMIGGDALTFRIQLKYGAWKSIAQTSDHARRLIEFTISDGRHSGTGLEEIHEDGSETFTPLDSLGNREP